ncbi:hypothetical protein [Enterococcus casseliflavus]|uniref:hypothetical protein n=1 Tax=Enterococcus casseliflavus TaxID=37734 RepID=UPI0022E3AB08|nr:hypothetical protein [Enterococcus casseliflavus]
MSKVELVRRTARLIKIVGCLIDWKDKRIYFAKNHSEVNLFYYLRNAYSINELKDLMDYLLDILDDFDVIVLAGN